MARVDLQPVAIGLIDDRWASENLNATYSSYDQSGSRPGSAVANTNVQDAIPVLTGSQTYAIQVSVTKSGDPSIHERGSALAWKLDSEADTEWRGWSDVNFATSVRCLYADTGSAMIDIDSCTTPKGQKVITVFNTNDASDHTLSRALAESTQEFASPQTIVTTGRGPSTIFALPDDRVLILDVRGNTTDGPVVMIDPDGDGATWSAYSTEPFTTAIAGTPARARARYANEQVMCVIQNASDFLQYASSDLGATFSLVATTANTRSFGLTATRSGNFVLAYIDDANNLLLVKRFGNAFQSYDIAQQHQVATVTNTTEAYEIEITCDEDGRLYIFMSHPNAHASGAPSRMYVYMSSNEGDSWNLLSNGPVFSGSDNGNANIRYQKLSATWSMGRCYLFGERLSAPEGIIAFTLSGWSNVNNGETHTVGGRNALTTTTASGSTANKTTAGMWFPIDYPWATATGYTTNDPGAGTAALAGGPDSQILQIAGGASLYFDSTLASATTASVDRVVVWRNKVTTGTGVASIEIGVQVNNPLVDGANRSTVDVRFKTDGIRVIDQADATNRTDIAVDCTDYRDYMLRVNERSVEFYYREDASNNWTQGATLTLTTTALAAGFTTQFIKWGHFVGSKQSEWQYVAHQFNGSTASVNFLAKARNFTKAIGKRITSRGYPLPTVGLDSLVTRLRYVGAFARVKEEEDGDYTITPEYDFGIHNIFPQESGSPTNIWKASTLSFGINKVIACDFGSITRFEEKLPFIMVRNANWKSATIEYSTTGGSWTSLGTMNLAYGFENSQYTLTGNTVTPNTASAVTGSRWIHADEFVGGTALLTSGGATTAHEIESNTAGDWNTGSSVISRLRLKDAGGGAASGTIDIVSPNGLFLPTAFADADIRYIRITITGSRTPDDYFEAGTITVGACIVPGKRWARGWSISTVPIVESTIDSSGTMVIKQKGPPRKSLTFNWDDGVKVDRLRSGIGTADYLSADTGTTALAGRDDVWWQLEGLLSRSRGGELPVVAIQRVPTSTSTITDPSMFVFGLLNSSITVNHVLGESGVDEFVRVETVQVTELT